MPFLDQSTPDGAGAQLRQKMLDSGAPQPQVDTYVQTQRQKMLDAGAPVDQVNSYWGITQPSSPDPMAGQLSSEVEPHTHDAGNPYESWVAGLQESNMGLAATSGKPSVTPNPNGGPFDAIAQTAGNLVGNLPSMVEGGIAGAVAGISGGPAGVVTGATMGANMWPAALREMLLKRYNTNGPWTAQDAMQTALNATSSAAKAGIATVVGEGAGGAVESQIEKAGIDPVVSKITGLLAGSATTTETGAVLDGKLAPSANDFIAGAVTAVGLSAGSYIGEGAGRRFVPTEQGKQVIQNLQDLYTRTGLSPEEVNHLAGQYPEVQQEVVRARSASGYTATPTLDAFGARAGRQTGKSFGPVPSSPYEPLAQEPEQVEATEEPKPGFMKPEQVPQTTLDVFHTLEGSADNAVSPDGAIGRYQIMPDTARAYGFDPNQLTNPAYNERAARAVLADLDNRFKGNLADMMVAYNAGPRRATTWIRGGRDFASLPLETQKYLLHGEQIGAIDGGFTAKAADADLVGDPAVAGADMPRGAFPTAVDDQGQKIPLEQVDREGNATQEPDEPLQITKEGTTPDSAHAEFASKIGELEGPESWAAKLNLGKVWRGFQFALTPAHQFDINYSHVGLKGTEGEKTVGIEDALRAANGGTSGMANQFYTKGPIKLGVDENGAPTFSNTEGANHVAAYKLASDRGGTFDGFIHYRIAQRTLEKAEQGVKTGFTPEAARAIVNEPGAFEKYDAASRMIQDANNARLDFMVKSGVLSPERVDAMRALNDEYVSMNRMVDKSYQPPNYGGMFGVRQPFKKMEGSDRPLIPPEIAEMDNVNTQVRMAVHNSAVLFTIDKLRAADPGFATLVKITKNTAVKEVEDAKEALSENAGIELPDEVKKAMEPILTARELLAHFNHERGLSEPDKDVVVLRNGEPEVWRINEPNIAKMVKSIQGGPDDPLPNLLGKFAQYDKAGIMSTPEFAARALWHATLGMATFNEGGSHLPFGNLLYGTVAALAGDRLGGHFKDAYDRFAANGGLGGTYNEVNRNMISTNLRKVMNGDTGDKIPAIVNVARNTVEAIRTVQHMVHNSMQVGSMIASESRGIPTLRAAQLARKGGLDYSEKFVSPVLNGFARTIPFFPTAFKDIQQVAQSLSDHPVATAARISALLIAPTLINLAANKAADQGLDPKDRYDNLPLWLRDNYWVLPPINGVRVKIPKPYVGGAMFATMPERFFNAAFDQIATGDNEQAKSDLKDWVQGVLGKTGVPYIPTAIEPPLEQVTNHSFFLNRPLVPDALARQSGYMQYGPNTSKSSIAVAKFMSQTHAGIGPVHLDQTSPLVLDNYINEWAGRLPAELWHDLGDTGTFKPEILGKIGLTGEEPKEAADTPFFGSFIVRNPGAGQAVDDYYDRAQQVDQAHADLSRAIKDKDQSEFAKARANPLVTISFASSTKALANMRGFINSINKSDMSDQEKLRATDQLSTQMFELAHAKVLQVDRLKQ